MGRDRIGILKGSGHDRVFALSHCTNVLHHYLGRGTVSTRGPKLRPHGHRRDHCSLTALYRIGPRLERFLALAPTKRRDMSFTGPLTIGTLGGTLLTRFCTMTG